MHDARAAESARGRSLHAQAAAAAVSAAEAKVTAIRGECEHAVAAARTEAQQARQAARERDEACMREVRRF